MTDEQISLSQSQSSCTESGQVNSVQTLKAEISKGLTKELVEKLKELEESKVILLINKKGTGNSDVWKSFKQLWYSNPKEYLNLAKCINRGSIYKQNSGSGTSNLSRHKCHAQMAISCFSKSAKEIGKTDKAELLTAQVDFTNQSLSSFRINNNELFLKLADKLIEIGAKYGNIQAKSILSSG